jgi:uncharacterized protein YaaN involved in tellurite resistance
MNNSKEVQIISSDAANEVDTLLQLPTTEKDLAQIQELAKGISPISLTDYGAIAQSKADVISSRILDKVKVKEIDDNKLIVDLLGVIKKVESPNSFLSKIPILSRWDNSISKYIVRANSVLSEIDSITNKLSTYSEELQSNYEDLEDLFLSTKETVYDSSVLIQALEQRLKDEKRTLDGTSWESTEIKKYSVVNQEVQDRIAFIRNIETKIYDMKVSAIAMLQMLPQIRMLQENSSQLISKTKVIVGTTIPIWKNSIAMNISTQKQIKVMQIQREVRRVTNEMIVNNAKTIRQLSSEVMKDSYESVISIDTLKAVQQELLQQSSDAVKISEQFLAVRSKLNNELSELIGKEKRLLQDYVVKTAM